MLLQGLGSLEGQRSDLVDVSMHGVLQESQLRLFQ